jgi:AcrR family transcriptional regulator
MASSSTRLKDRMALQRSEILAVALGVFLRVGYSRASIAGIVGEMGKAKSWLYTYYPSKESLFLDIVYFMAEEAAAAYGPAPERDVSLEDALRVVGLRYLDIVLDKTHVDFYRMTISEADHLPQIGEIFHNHLRAASIEPLAFHLQRAVESASATFTDYLAAGEFFYDLCASSLHRRALVGIQRHFTAEDRRANVDRAVGVFLNLVLPAH